MLVLFEEASGIRDAAVLQEDGAASGVLGKKGSDVVDLCMRVRVQGSEGKKREGGQRRIRIET
jgi:hypothetical protein